MVDRAGVSVNQASGGGGEGGIRPPDGFPRTAFPVRRHRPLGDLSEIGGRASNGPGNGGEGGIRTHGAHRTPLFESGTLNHSDTSPPGGESTNGSDGVAIEPQAEAGVPSARRRASASRTPEMIEIWWGRDLLRASWRTVPALPRSSSGTAKTRARTWVSSRAPTHMGHGSLVVKMVTSDSRRVPSFLAAARMVSI